MWEDMPSVVVKENRDYEDYLGTVMISTESHLRNCAYELKNVLLTKLETHTCPERRSKTHVPISRCGYVEVIQPLLTL